MLAILLMNAFSPLMNYFVVGSNIKKRLARYALTHVQFFTSIVTIILGGFLSVAAGTLKETQDLNVENDSKKNILASLGFFKPEGESKWSSDDITKLFEENIDAYVLDSNGERTSVDPSSVDTETDKENFPIYVDKRDGAVNGYAIPISEKGLWSTLYGYFAVDPDCTVTAKRNHLLFSQRDTGTWREVEKPWFQNNFIGKDLLMKMAT